MSAAAAFPDVDVIIVAHDAGPFLEAAVASVEGQVAPGRVTVVGAGSIDGSVDGIARSHADVRVIRTENRGLGAATNAGLIATSGEFVLLLESDAVLDELCLGTLVSRAKANRTAAIVAPRITDVDGRTQEGSFGPFPTLPGAMVMRANLIVHAITKRREARPRADVVGTTPVDWVVGACMLVRRRAIEAVGPMDEGFSGYFEDIEWCRRMHEGGWTVVIEPTATCTHTPAPIAEPRAELKAYRASFLRYCKLQNLRTYALAARLGLTARSVPAGRA